MTLRDIRNAAQTEAVRIATVQGALVRLGDRAAVSPDQLRLQEIWEKCALVMDILLGDEALRNRVFAAMKEPNAGQAGAAT